MPSLFPYLLNYQFFATTLIRVAAALALFYASYHYAITRDEIKRTKVVIAGHIPQWLSLFGALVIFVAAVLLFVGLYTQAAAIVGMIIGLKHMTFARRYPAIMPLSAIAGALLFIMCLSLLLSGAGAFAFDLPL